MSLYNNMVYPMTGVDNAIADITNNLTRHIVSKFPYGTFHEDSIFIDTMGNISDHKRRTTGLSKDDKIKKPILVVTTTNGLSDIWDTSEIPQTNQYTTLPGWATDRRLNSSSRLCVLKEDRVGIHVDTSYFIRKLELNFKMEFDSKADLNLFKSQLYNTVSINAWDVIKYFKYDVVLPNLFVSDISRLGFKHGTISLSNEEDVDKLTTYLNDNGHFLFEKKYKDVGNGKDMFITMNNEVSLYYFPTIPKDGDGSDNEKDGEVYEKFTLNMNIKLDIKIPTNLFVSYKVYNGINKTMVDNVYFNNILPDRETNYRVTLSKPIYIEDRETIIPPKNRNYNLCVREEFFIELPEETLQITSFLDPTTILWAVIERCTIAERKGLFETHIYENRVFVDKKDCMEEDVGTDIVYHLKKCDPDLSFSIFIYVDMVKLNQLIPIILDRIKDGVFPHQPNVIGSYPPSSDPTSGSTGSIGSSTTGGIGGDDLTGTSQTSTNSLQKSSGPIYEFDANIIANSK